MPPAKDFEYAKSKGYMFDPISISHDEAVEWLLSEVRLANVQTIAHAFVASLGNRRLDLRSALGSYGFATNLPRHEFVSTPNKNHSTGALPCRCCGFVELASGGADLNLLNFERHKWGGVRHDEVVYAAFDLEQFRKQPVIIPERDDFDVLIRIFDAAIGMAEDGRPNDLEKKLAGVFKSNRNERRVLITILGFCGVLQARQKGGYFNEFTFEFDREVTDEHKNDWSYPIMWWGGKDGINTDAVKHFFPEIR